jgi:predicted nucleic acid-binding protein
VSIVFDTEALLAFYLGEAGGKKVEKYLTRIMKGELEGYLNIINLSELFYILYRKSPALAEEKEQNLRNYGLKIVPVDDDGLWREAAKIKARHPLSSADAFTVATAKMMKASLLTGRDAELHSVDVPVERIR